ncbi:MAG: hypothetical protein Kow0037_30640 [Calditrichia bacterium]
MKRTVRYLLIIVTVLLGLGCAKRIYQVAYPTLHDGHYDSEFPYKSSSGELSEIAEAVLKLNTVAYYKSYVFSPEKQVTSTTLKMARPAELADREYFYHNSVIGTATVLQHYARRVLLVTCNHVIDFPDTVISTYKESGFIQSISFKERQDNFVGEFPASGSLEVIARDVSSDLALLAQNFGAADPPFLAEFRYPFGKARELEWGSFVYMIGYPKGYKMVTKGIVSQPQRSKDGNFIVDALFNRGFSGGIVLAIRDGIPNFELVGIATSVSADFGFHLVPDQEEARLQDPRVPYRGENYVKLEKIINYGITFVTPVEALLNFLEKNSEMLKREGFDVKRLLDKKE